jgi:uncharacterized membrane protein
LINHHSIIVKAPVREVFGEILLWGEAAWWPQESPMRYTRITPGEDIKAGCRYRQKVHMPFGPEWDVEVISVTEGREVSRRFLNGMFEGVDRVYIIPVDRESCEVHFLMDFKVVGTINRIVWDLLFRAMHDKNIKRILLALKSHVETRQGVTDESGVEEYPSTPEEADRRRFLKGVFKR